MTTTTEPARRTPAEIEREIAEDRRRLAATSGELQERLSVGALLDEAMQRTGAQGGDIARNLGDAMRRNPLPLALVGVGLAWMLVGGGSRRGTYGTMSAYGGPRARHLAEPAPGPSGIPRSGVDWDVREDDDTYPPSRGSTASGGAAERARRQTSAAGDSLDDIVERQPLVVGGLAMALGAAIGGLLPTSRPENQAMGAEAERLRHEAGNVAATEGAKARRVAGAAAGEAKRAADEAAAAADAGTPGGRGMVERAEAHARDAAGRVARTAEDEARRQDLGGSLDRDRG